MGVVWSNTNECGRGFLDLWDYIPLSCIVSYRNSLRYRCRFWAYYHGRLYIQAILRRYCILCRHPTAMQPPLSFYPFLPTYTRSTLPPHITHLGTGAYHQKHRCFMQPHWWVSSATLYWVYFLRITRQKQCYPIVYTANTSPFSWSSCTITTRYRGGSENTRCRTMYIDLCTPVETFMLSVFSEYILRQDEIRICSASNVFSLYFTVVLTLFRFYTIHLVVVFVRCYYIFLNVFWINRLEKPLHF